MKEFFTEETKVSLNFYLLELWTIVFIKNINQNKRCITEESDEFCYFFDFWMINTDKNILKA